MRSKNYTEKEKRRVKSLLLSGSSYSEITKLVNVPRSTISTWFGKSIKRPVDKKARLEHLKRIRKLAAIAIKNKWRTRHQKELEEINISVAKEIPSYPLDNIGFYKALLSMLYWAEGEKQEKTSGAKFVNTDPSLALLYITLLRKCYLIDERRLRARLHLHYYHSIKKSRKFWSELLKIPTEQFTKTYIKERSKTKRFRKNFNGICFIGYNDSRIRKELLVLGKQLQKIITKTKP